MESFLDSATMWPKKEKKDFVLSLDFPQVTYNFLVSSSGMSWVTQTVIALQQAL